MAPGSSDRSPTSKAPGAFALPSGVRREPHGEPGAGEVGTGEPDSQALLARQIETPSRAGARFGEFRFVVTFLRSQERLGFGQPPNPAARAPASGRGFRRATTVKGGNTFIPSDLFRYVPKQWHMDS